jgi:hypothetical protein
LLPEEQNERRRVWLNGIVNHILNLLGHWFIASFSRNETTNLGKWWWIVSKKRLVMIGNIPHSDIMTTSKASAKPVDHQVLVFACSESERVSFAGRAWCVGLKGWLRVHLSKFVPPWGFEDETGFHYGIPSDPADSNRFPAGEHAVTGS